MTRQYTFAVINIADSVAVATSAGAADSRLTVTVADLAASMRAEHPLQDDIGFFAASTSRATGHTAVSIDPIDRVKILQIKD